MKKKTATKGFTSECKNILDHLTKASWLHQQLQSLPQQQRSADVHKTLTDSTVKVKVDCSTLHCAESRRGYVSQQ